MTATVTMDVHPEKYFLHLCASLPFVAIAGLKAAMSVCWAVFLSETSFKDLLHIIVCLLKKVYDDMHLIHILYNA